MSDYPIRFVILKVRCRSAPLMKQLNEARLRPLGETGRDFVVSIIELTFCAFKLQLAGLVLSR